MLSTIGFGFLTLLPQLGSYSEAEKEADRQSFQKAWEIVRDTHWDPEFGGLDWDAIHRVYSRLVAKSTSREDFRWRMSRMFELLDQSHFYLIPEDRYSRPETGAGHWGFDFDFIGLTAWVRSVEPDSSAAKAGIRPGWELVQVEEVDVIASLLKAAKERITRVDAALKGLNGRFPEKHEPLPQSLELLSDYSKGDFLESLLRGSVGAEKTLVFKDESDEAVTVLIALGPPRGEKFEIPGLPPSWVEIKSRELVAGIGYLRLSSFVIPPELAERRFAECFKRLEGKHGIVLDLRGNRGGLSATVQCLAGFLTNKEGQTLGKLRTRQGDEDVVIPARPDAFEGPLAILIDDCSASGSESLAEGMRDLGRARLFGSRSGGSLLVGNTARLSNGDGFVHATKLWVSNAGKAVEGRGVRPDTKARASREDLRAGRDPVLDAAVEWLSSAANR